MSTNDWFRDSFRHEYDKQADNLGRFNLALFGKTGVGKSTLINAIFGEPVAATGIGEPVTEGSHLYLDKRGQLGLIDTQGLEIGRDDKELLADVTKTVNRMRKQPVAEQIHAVWFCVRGMDRRFEESEAAFIRKLDELGLPVIVVLTQVPEREGQIHPDAQQLVRVIEEKHLPIEGIYCTYAQRDHFTGQPPHGLMELLHATFRVAPEAVHGALTAAQKIDLARKAREAHKAVGAAASGAAAAAATPIPFSDAALLVPIQLGMMARIAQLYNLKVDRAALLAIASTSAATSAGRATFTSLLKFFPGAGTVAGGVIGAGVASGFTVAMGEAWIAVCQKAAGGALPSLNGVIDSQAVQDLFMTEFRKRVPGIKRQADRQG